MDFLLRSNAPKYKLSEFGFVEFQDDRMIVQLESTLAILRSSHPTNPNSDDEYSK
jgi:hypothetical protein